MPMNKRKSSKNPKRTPTLKSIRKRSVENPSEKSTYVQFKSATGTGGASKKELKIRMTDYMDIAGDSSDPWYVHGYDIGYLPGFKVGLNISTTTIEKGELWIMQPAFAGDNSRTNVMILYDTMMRFTEDISTDISPSFVGVQSTYVQSAVDPKWIKVGTTNFDQAFKDGLGFFHMGDQSSEFFRVSLVNPDDGVSYTSSTRLQAKFVVHYSKSVDLESSTPANSTRVALPGGLGTGTQFNTTVFCDATGLSNKL